MVQRGPWTRTCSLFDLLLAENNTKKTSYRCIYPRVDPILIVYFTHELFYLFPLIARKLFVVRACSVCISSVIGVARGMFFASS